MLSKAMTSCLRTLLAGSFALSLIMTTGAEGADLSPPPVTNQLSSATDWRPIQAQSGAPSIGVEVRAAKQGRGTAGVSVVEVQADGPAARAGIQPGDVILAINGFRTDGLEDYHELVGALTPLVPAELFVSRHDRIYVMFVTPVPAE